MALLPFSSFAMDKMIEEPRRLNQFFVVFGFLIIFLMSYPLLIITKSYIFHFIAIRDSLYGLSDANYSSTHKLMLTIIIFTAYMLLTIVFALVLMMTNTMLVFSILGIIVSAAVTFLSYYYIRRYGAIMRFFLHSRKDFVKVLDLVALKQVAKDPDWFRHDEKRLVQLCQRYSVDPKIFSNIFPVEQYLHNRQIGEDIIQP